MQDKKPEYVYLTSGCCEDTQHVSLGELEELGLKIDPEYDYPLTRKESMLIAEAYLEIGGEQFLAGYSVLMGDKKYIAPCCEFDETGIELGQALQQRLLPSIKELGGDVRIGSSIDDRIEVSVLIPFDYLFDQGVTSFDDLGRFLSEKFPAPGGAVAIGP